MIRNISLTPPLNRRSYFDRYFGPPFPSVSEIKEKDKNMSKHDEVVGEIWSRFRFRDHGGHCCGVKHIYTFWCSSNHTNQQRKEALERKLEGLKRDGLIGSICVEAVITENQQKYWHEVLLKVGFTPAKTWVNRNSGNTCTMYLLGV